MFSNLILGRSIVSDKRLSKYEKCNKVYGPATMSESLKLRLPPSADYTAAIHIDNTERSFRVESRDGPIVFPLQTVLPKVNMLKVREAKKMPKDVAVERRYREYAQTDLEKELKKVGIQREDLHPTEEQFHYMSDISFKHFFPLSLFDDTRYETRSVAAWLSLASLEDKQVDGVPAKAYVPVEKSFVRYEWQMVSVFDYDYNVCLWKVLNLNDMIEYDIPNTQLVFVAEDPINFVRRLKKANKQRRIAESRFRIILMIDMCFVFDSRDLYFNGQKRIDKMLAKSTCSVQFLDELREEAVRIFQRIMNLYDVDVFLKQFPDDLPSFRSLINKDILTKAARTIIKVPRISVAVRRKRFTRKVMNLNRKSLYYNVAAYEAMQNVVSECQEVEKMSLFLVHIAKPLSLGDFVSGETAQNQTIANFLTKNWPLRIASRIILVLRPEGRGFLDVTLTRFVIYLMCKVALLIYQVKLRMEDTIFCLLETSIENFINVLTLPCQGFTDIQDDFVWTNNFKESHFPWKNPIFFLVVSIIDTKQVIYSNDPEEFAPALVDLFKKGLERIAPIRCIDAETMTNLTFDPNLYIRTVEFVEDLFELKSEYLTFCYQRAVIPLRAYLKIYDPFIHFYLTHIGTYMRLYQELHKPSSEVKADIIGHKEQITYLQESLPDLVHIGPFQVNILPIKTYLINKHTELVGKILEYYVDRMYQSSEFLLEEGAEIFNTINDRPTSIEHLISIREYAAVLPELLDQYKTEIQKMVLEYDILDYFFVNVSDVQFAMKWDVIAWPYKIVKRMATLKEEQKQDFEDFQRQHESEFSSFEDHLTSLNEEVQGFSLQMDPNKVMEMSADVKKTTKNVAEASNMAEILQARQKLFNLPPLDLSFLDKIKLAFVPYKTLWTSGAEARKLQDASVGNPLSMVDVKEVFKAINDLRVQFVEVSKEFDNKPELQMVAVAFTKNLKAFVPILESMKFLKNENWLTIHWQELATLSGLEIKYTPTINFLSLMKKGIMDHLDLIKEVGTRAIEDADEIRRRLAEEERLRQEEALRILEAKQKRKCRRDIL